MPLQLDELPPLDSLAALERPAGQGGLPLMLPLHLIDEDPAQPRVEFDEASIQDLAATIAQRGVKQPISVRPHPAVPGRWMLNFGARRLRASKIAGKSEIPAFMDEAADSFDQVIENEQRDALRPLDLALFVKRQIDGGMTRADIARRLGKSAMYITYVCALVDPPDWLMNVYRAGKCRGIRELHELRRLHESVPREVEAFVGSVETVSRGSLASFQAGIGSEGVIDSPARDAQRDVASEERAPSRSKGSSSKGSTPQRPDRAPSAVREAASVPVVLATIDGVRGRVVTDSAPAQETHVFVMLDGEEALRSVPIAALQALRLER
ncbi:MAG: ParB/RepB/Spo0J family partition protein [Burkholderiaceae bacterium]|nr:ParB/RepB/Spo0J family partition protein [Burkholderiaceae bacterium]